MITQQTSSNEDVRSSGDNAPRGYKKFAVGEIIEDSCIKKNEALAPGSFRRQDTFPYLFEKRAQVL